MEFFKQKKSAIELLSPEALQSMAAKLSQANALEPELMRKLEAVAGNGAVADIVTNVKEATSLAEKLVKKGLTSAEGIKDVLRAALFMKDSKAIMPMVAKILASFDVVEVDFKVGGKGNSYKGTCHLDLNLDGMIVELQVMNMMMWDFKELAHVEYKAGNAAATGWIFNEAVERINERRDAYSGKIILP
jgi:hypothetical protein